MTHTYKLAAIKTFRGMEGQGFNSNVMKDGQRIGTIDDEGNGGMYRIHIDRAERPEFDAFVKQWYEATNQHDKLIAGMREFGGAESVISKVEVANAEGMAEAWASEQFIRHMTTKDIKRWSKTKTIFMLTTDKPGEYRTLTKPYTPAAEAHIRQKYGSTVKAIYNPADESSIEGLL